MKGNKKWGKSKKTNKKLKGDVTERKVKGKKKEKHKVI